MSQEHYDFSASASRFLQTSEVLIGDCKAESFTIVIVGGAGGLTKRMPLPTLILAELSGIRVMRKLNISEL